LVVLDQEPDPRSLGVLGELAVSFDDARERAPILRLGLAGVDPDRLGADGAGDVEPLLDRLEVGLPHGRVGAGERPGVDRDVGDPQPLPGDLLAQLVQVPGALALEERRDELDGPDVELLARQAQEVEQRDRLVAQDRAVQGPAGDADLHGALLYEVSLIVQGAGQRPREILIVW
jgi:hypothetical protein